MVPYIFNFFESSNLFACDIAASPLNWSIAFLCATSPVFDKKVVNRCLVLSSFNFFELNERVQKSTFTARVEQRRRYKKISANVRTHAPRKLYKTYTYKQIQVTIFLIKENTQYTNIQSVSWHCHTVSWHRNKEAQEALRLVATGIGAKAVRKDKAVFLCEIGYITIGYIIK